MYFLEIILLGMIQEPATWLLISMIAEIVFCFLIFRQRKIF
jgi:hypothetical protein